MKTIKTIAKNPGVKVPKAAHTTRSLGHKGNAMKVHAVKAKHTKQGAR